MSVGVETVLDMAAEAGCVDEQMPEGTARVQRYRLAQTTPVIGLAMERQCRLPRLPV